MKKQKASLVVEGATFDSPALKAKNPSVIALFQKAHTLTVTRRSSSASVPAQDFRPSSRATDGLRAGRTP